MLNREELKEADQFLVDTCREDKISFVLAVDWINRLIKHGLKALDKIEQLEKEVKRLEWISGNSEKIPEDIDKRLNGMKEVDVTKLITQIENMTDQECEKELEKYESEK